MSIFTKEMIFYKRDTSLQKRYSFTKEIQFYNTPGTAGGPGGSDRTLAVKSRKYNRKSAFVKKKDLNKNKKNYLFFL